LKKNKFFSSWGTKKEIDFLKGIGTHNNPPKSRQRCLIGYLRASRQRYDWGAINKRQVIEFAEYLLEIETR